MTDTETTYQDNFDDAQEEFPGKEDLKDRLVLIWVTGKHGIRKSAAPGSKPYDWYETITLVIDDGPNWDGYKIVDDEKVPVLVPSVKEEGPQRMDNFQFTMSGLTARLSQRVHLSPTPAVVNGPPVVDKPKTFAPMLGRINSRRNKQSGFAASWSIAKPTDSDKAIARKPEISKLINEITDELKKAVETPAAGDEFDE